MMTFPFLAADLEALQCEVTSMEAWYQKAASEARGPGRSLYMSGSDGPSADFDTTVDDVRARQVLLTDLRSFLEQAVIVQLPITNDVVAIGTRVTLASAGGETFEIELGSYRLTGEAPDTDRVSCSSPLGQKLLGCKVGDQVIGVGPNNLSYTVRAITVVRAKELASSAV